MIYNAPLERFERKLRKAFPKFKKFSLTQSKKETGSGHIQVKKYLLELVRRGKLRTADWPCYYFVRSPDKRMGESLTALKKVNDSAVSEDEELRSKMMNMERDLQSWKTAKNEIEEMLFHSNVKDLIVAS